MKKKNEGQNKQAAEEGIIEVWETAPDDASREEVLRQAEEVAERLVEEKMQENFREDLEEAAPPKPMIAHTRKRKKRK